MQNMVREKRDPAMIPRKFPRETGHEKNTSRKNRGDQKKLGTKENQTWRWKPVGFSADLYHVI